MEDIRGLWASVVSHALETAVKELPKLDKSTYGLRRLEKARAKSFFKSVDSNLGFACRVLDLPEDKMRSKGLNIIKDADRRE